jgi:hypothetical protein
MKTLGLCFMFVSSILIVAASAQQSDTLALNTDDAALQKWARGDQIRMPRIIDDNVILSMDDHQPACAFMRTYRVKREARDSDATRSASYTKCVPIERFAVKRAIRSRAVPSESR